MDTLNTRLAVSDGGKARVMWRNFPFLRCVRGGLANYNRPVSSTRGVFKRD